MCLKCSSRVRALCFQSFPLPVAEGSHVIPLSSEEAFLEAQMVGFSYGLLSTDFSGWA